MSATTVPMESNRAEGFVDVYINTFRMGATGTDFTLFLGATDDVQGRISQKDRVAARVSPQMLKLIIINITATLDAYEETFGTIQVPKNATEEADANRKKMTTFYKQQAP